MSNVANPSFETWPLFPPVVHSILSNPDTVEVMTVDPVESEEGPNLIHGHEIRGVARVPTPDRRKKIGQALTEANHAGVEDAECFDPHYAVRISRHGQTADFLICFLCNNVQVFGPGNHSGLYPIDESAAGVLKKELRRAGVGWLWFWRKWLPLH